MNIQFYVSVCVCVKLLCLYYFYYTVVIAINMLNASINSFSLFQFSLFLFGYFKNYPLKCNAYALCPKNLVDTSALTGCENCNCNALHCRKGPLTEKQCCQKLYFCLIACFRNKIPCQP